MKRSLIITLLVIAALSVSANSQTKNARAHHNERVAGDLYAKCMRTQRNRMRLSDTEKQNSPQKP